MNAYVFKQVTQPEMSGSGKHWQCCGPLGTDLAFEY